MIGLEQLERLWTSLKNLGPRRLAALGIIGLSVFALTGLGGYLLSCPTMETLYSGLDRDDISAIGSALKDADIPFDVSADGEFGFGSLWANCTGPHVARRKGAATQSKCRL